MMGLGGVYKKVVVKKLCRAMTYMVKKSQSDIFKYEPSYYLPWSGKSDFFQLKAMSQFKMMLMRLTWKWVMMRHTCPKRRACM